MNVELVDNMGSDLTVVNAARVSFGKHAVKFSPKDKKLIDYLAKHKHWSPFAHCFVQFRIKAPIFVARQLVKHQVGLTWNEVSRRYVDDAPEFYMPEVWRGKPENSKQGSTGNAKSQYFPDLYIKDVVELAADNYRKMIMQGVAPEMARMILPQNTYTEWYWSGSLMAFARVCDQRLDPHTQEETQHIAKWIDNFCREKFPYSWNALRGNEDEL